MITPYYDHGGITIYHGDCWEVLPQLGHFDLLLTDPPYGIARVWKGGFWGRAKTREEAPMRNAWDETALDEQQLATLFAHSDAQVFWGGNYFPLPPSRGWLVWNKPERNFSLAEAELAWTSRDMVVRVLDAVRSEPGRLHPTQKPLRVMSWTLGFFPNAGTVLDPFLGSGTTARASKDRGLRCVGIEREERYCEIAAKRLEQEVMPGMEAI